MLNLVSSQAALGADRIAEQDFGYPPLLLMEEAGIRLQDRLDRLEADGAWGAGPVVYLVGPGNNGGDALAMARQAWLRGRKSVSMVQVFPSESPPAVWNGNLVRTLGIECCLWPSDRAGEVLRSGAVWVDGIWGAGLRGPLRPGAAQVIADLEELRKTGHKKVCALDVPSGLWEGWGPGDPVLRASWTLAPGWSKDFCFYPGARDFAGILVSVPLAFPVPAEFSAILAGEGDLPGLLPPVAPGDHKGTRGHVALAGGFPGMTGAVVLAARSAAAAGAGLISLGLDSGLISLVAPQVPAFQVRPFSEIEALASRYDSVVIGPGWGRGGDRSGLLEKLWKTGLPLVVDADGLAAWADLNLPIRDTPMVLTPHPGEFRRLGAPPGNPVASAGTFARDRGVTIVLKGAVTWILAPDGRRAVWDCPNPALGTGGSGDCLSGVVGALLARGLGGFEASVAGVALHGSAGKHLAEESGWFTADQLPGAIARTAASCRKASGPL